MVKSKLDFALETLELGLPVFPVTHTLPDGSCSCPDPMCSKPGKHPLPGSDGFKNATADPKEVRKFWAKHPDANIAAYPGADYVVIDLDCKTLPNGKVIVGLDNLAAHLEMDAFELLGMTYTVETPSGGYHLYFKADSEYSSGVGLIPGVDSRAVGGYVLAPGSDIHGREYKVVNPGKIEPIAENVGRFLRKVRDKQTDAHKTMFEPDLPAAIDYVRTFLKKRAPAIEGSGGNAHTYATVCQVKDRAISQGKCLELLMEPGGWNDTCQPPWEASELAVVAENAYSYGKDRPGSKGGGALDLFTDAVQDISEIMKDGIGDDNDPYARFRANFYTGLKFSQISREYRMLAPGWIPAQGITCFLAQRSMGKTTIMLDICMRLACDMNWNEIPLKSGWSVCWIVGEDAEGVIVRMRAWQKHHGVKLDPERFHVLDMALDMNKSSEVELFARFVNGEFVNRQNVVFVLDTWQRMTQSAESQSNDKDMQLAIHNAEALARSFNGPCLIANHPPKANANTIMGSTIIENSSQAIIQIVDHGGGLRKAQVTRIKGEGYGNHQLFNFPSVVYDDEPDEFGMKRTSVIAFCEGTGKTKSPELMAQEAAVVDVLAGLILFQGEIKNNSGYVANEISISQATGLFNQIRRRADEKEPHFEGWCKALSDTHWRFAVETKERKDSFKGKVYDRIIEIVKESSVHKPITVPSYPDRGIYIEKATKGKGFVIRMRRIELAEPPANEDVEGPDPNLNKSLDNPVDVSEFNDA